MTIREKIDILLFTGMLGTAFFVVMLLVSFFIFRGIPYILTY